MSTDRSEDAFLREYDPGIYARPNCTVDTAIFTVSADALHVLAVRRHEHPFIGKLALPGGFIDIAADKDLEATAWRKLFEKTGVAAPYLEQFGTVGNNARDPRGWTVTTVYFALVSASSLRMPADSGDEVQWCRIRGTAIDEPLAFDHAELLAGCLGRLRSKALYTSLPLYLMPPSFTLGELQKMYEIVLDATLEQKSFRRRMMGTGILEETGEFNHNAKRPAQLYRAYGHRNPYFFLRNLEGASPSPE